MALEGSLREFNVADILQLIFFQKKTGVLILQGRFDRVRVLFFDGNIVGADSRKRSIEKRLGMILLKRGLISREQIEAVIEKQRTEGGKFGAVLTREGYVTKEQIKEVLTFQITEVMVQVFSMKEGRYEFKPQSVPVDREVGVVLNTEHFLMEGVRLVDEWSQIEGKITLEDVFIRTENPPRVKVSEEERKIYEFVDGENTVADITDVSGIDSYSVSSALLSLAEKGVVYMYQDEEESPVDKGPKPKRDIPALSLILYVIICFAVLLSAGSILGAKSNYRLFLASEEIDSLRNQIQTAYFASGGRFPESVQEKDPWGRQYRYVRYRSTFELNSAGPDGYFGTDDDVPRGYLRRPNASQSPSAPAEQASASESAADSNTASGGAQQ